MFAIICRRRLRVPSKDSIFIGPQFFASKNTIFGKSFSSEKSSSDVNEDDPQQSFTVSYLINSWGLSSKDALSVSKKVCIKSPEKPDATLEILRKYGFTDSYVTKLVTRWPVVLTACPEKTILPKLEFFRSIGIPLPALAQTLSVFPMVLQRSLENYLIPSYNFVKSLVGSDKAVVNVFSRAPRTFAHGWQREISSNVAVLRERGVRESSIVWMFTNHPSLLMFPTEKFVSYIDRAIEMGFDRSKIKFIHAIQVFAEMSETTLKHKMETYRKCGWSESDIAAAFLRHPLCLKLSEKKITANMNFFVNELGFKPAAIAEFPLLLGLNLEKRMRPRYLVVKILKAKGLFLKRTSFQTLLKMPEEMFFKRFVVSYQEDIPQLLDIYQGKLSLSEIEFSQELNLNEVLGTGSLHDEAKR